MARFVFGFFAVGAVLGSPTFDEPFVTTAIEAAELSIVVKSKKVDKKKRDFDYFEYFSDSETPNRALVVKKEGVCYAAFRSKTPHPLRLMIWRIVAFFLGKMPFFDDVCSMGQCCRVRTPVYRDYLGMPYSFAADVEEAARECVATCEGESCPLVLTGHATGGAVAHLAGIRLADLEPMGFTFGSPEVIHKEGCDLLDSQRWYRFVNSVESQHRRDWGYPKGGLVYDFIPLAYDKLANTSYRSASHIGYLLVLSYDFTIANLGLDSNKRMTTASNDARKMFVEGADRYTRGYLDRLVAIYEAFSLAGFPVPSGYASRDLCTLDAECAEPMVCMKECFVCPPRCGMKPEVKRSRLRY